MFSIRERIGLILTLVTLSFFYPNPALAASLLGYCDSSFFDVSNCPKSSISFPSYKVVNGSATFNYKIDRGNLGEISETDARADAEEVLGLWEAESSLDFTRVGDGLITEDVTVSNYDEYLDSPSSLGYSPVIWDDDGSITDDLIGRGAKRSVLGFAGATFFTRTNGVITTIKESQCAFNGFLFDGSNTGDSPSTVANLFLTTILHEFGHMFGIDHTQGGDLEGFNDNDSDLTAVPVMFPIAANPLVELQQDDIAIARNTYPKGSESTTFGTIRGTLTTSGRQVKGLSIVAFKVDDANPRKRAVACPTDVDGQGNGTFVLPGLVPGEYILFAEKLDSAFTGGSSVGSHEPNTSFTSLFYNGEGLSTIKSSSLSTGMSRAKRITVTAGSTTTVSFETTSSSNNNGGSTTASFLVKGKAVNSATFLSASSFRRVKMKISNLNPSQTLQVKLSTEYPELISFLPSDTLSFKGNSLLLRVKFASFADFVAVFPELQNGESVDIPLTIEDLSTGYIDNGKTLTVF